GYSSCSRASRGTARRLGISALRRCALASLLLAVERRRIAHPKAQGYADLQGGVTAGICDRRNGDQESFCTATILTRSCPLWVNSGHRGKLEECPLYPQKRTLISTAVMSALCQKRTHAPQQLITSLGQVLPDFRQ